MTLLSRIRRSVVVPALTLVTFVATSVPLPAFAADVPTPPSPNGPGSPVFGVPESGGQQAAGALASADASRGVAHSAIPFKLPTARGKVQPALSLEYSSTSGQREAGIGWGLALPAIERHNDSGPPLYHDTFPGIPLDPNVEDHFTFAGQALVPICLVGASGGRASCAEAAPGEAMPSWANGWHYFRLEADALFARFFWSPDHKTWVVQQKSGERMEFGTPQDDPTGSQGGIGNEVDPSIPSSPTFRWRMVRRYDSLGPSTNVIYYHWQKLSPIRDLRYLTDIYDTPADTDGAAPIHFSEFAHHVHLSWRPEDNATPAPGHMPNPMSAALIWRQVPAFILSRVDVTSATMSSMQRQLVRSYALTYFERGSGASHFHRALLKSVQMTGACPNFTESDATDHDGDGTLPATVSCDGGTLPPTTMTYTGIDEPFSNVSSANETFLSPLFLGALMDVDGDGLPDVVSDQQDANRLIGPDVNFATTSPKPPFNIPGVTGASPLSWSVNPPPNSPGSLGASGTTLLSPDSSQWVIGNWTSGSQAPGASVLWWNSNASQYQVFVPTVAQGAGAWQAVSAGTLSANTALPPSSFFTDFGLQTSFANFADVDGDGLLDWIRQDPATNRVTSFYTTQDRLGIIHPLATPLTSEPIIPLPSRNLLGTQMQFFVDANGDGVPDIVTLTPHAGTGPLVDLTILRGHGDATFDPAPGYILDVLPAALSQEFSNNTARFFVHDVNGDGLADVIAYDATGLSVLLSTGRSLVAGQQIAPFEVPASPAAQISFADMNGSGVEDIVFSVPAFLDGELFQTTTNYVDILGGKPQALLSSISNGLGATTTLEYTSSSDRNPAVETFNLPQPETRNPQVLHLVSSITTTVAEAPGLSMSGAPYRTEYAYSGPVYDYRHRAFQGFEHVQTTRVNQDAPVLSEVTDTYFQLAELSRENGADILTCLLLPCGELDEQIQAIRGLPTFTSMSDKAGHYLSATHNEYLLETLYIGMDGRTTRRAYPKQTDRWNFDSVAVATGTANKTLTDIQGINDDVVAPPFPFGPPPSTVTRTRAYPFPVFEATPVHIESTQLRDLAGNVTNVMDLGVVDGAPTDSAITYATTFPPPDGDWLWRAMGTTTSGSGKSRSYEFHYDGQGNLREVHGDLSGTVTPHRFHEDPSAKVAAIPRSAAQDGPNQLLTRLGLDPYGNVEQVESDGGAQCSMVTYDSLFHQLPTVTTKFLDGVCGSAQTLVTKSRSYDRGFEVAKLLVGADGTMTTRQLDLFGRVTNVFLPDPEIPGIPETDASSITSYQIMDGGPYQVIRTQTRDDAGQAPMRRSSWTLLDALGRTVATVADASSVSNNDAAPRIVSGLVTRGSLGQVRAVYAPFFSTYPPSTSSLPSPGATPFYRFGHDAFGHTVTTFQLDGTLSSRVDYHALSRDIYDATDLAGSSPHPLTVTQDGHGRTVRTSQPTGNGGSTGVSADTLVTAAEYAPTGEMTHFTRSHSRGRDSYSRTMIYDSLGRLVRNSEPNTSTSSDAWTYAYDIGGQLVATADARGCGVNYAYDGAARETSEDYSPCLKAQPAYTDPQVNGDGTEALFHYDTPEFEQTTDFGPNTIFLKGKLASVSDRAQHSRYGYDGRGRRVSTAKQLLAVPVPGITDVSKLAQRYTPTWYRTEAAYDEADRPIAQTTGAEVAELQGASATVGGVRSTSLVSVTYDDRDIPVRVGGSYGALVTNEVHDADGLITSRQYGDFGKTTGNWNYTANRWPMQALLSRSSTSVTPSILIDETDQDYDPVGNATTLMDNRVVPAGAPGVPPVTRKLMYDDLYRLRDVKYSYTGDTTQTPLFGDNDLSPMPLPSPTNRVKHQSYDYDWQDNLVSSTDDSSSGFFNRSVGTETYGPPATGPNQLSAAAPSSPGSNATVTYDAAGNMTSIVEAVALSASAGPSFQLHYTWDEVGRLASAVRSDYLGTSLTQTTTLDYAYDASGQRVSKSVEVDGDGVGTPVYFLEIFPSLRENAATWDATTNDYDRDGTTETAYLAVGGASYGRVINDDSVPQNTSSTSQPSQHVYLQMSDRLGSTSSTVDLASGTLVEQSTYLPFGGGESDYRAPGWDSFRESYRYTGKEDDYQVGLIYYGERYFSPALGRWASADPLAIHGLSGDPNPYSFARGSPLRFVDPVGLDPIVDDNGYGYDPAYNWTQLTACADCDSTPGNGYVLFKPPTVQDSFSTPAPSTQDQFASFYAALGVTGSPGPGGGVAGGVPDGSVGGSFAGVVGGSSFGTVGGANPVASGYNLNPFLEAGLALAGRLTFGFPSGARGDTGGVPGGSGSAGGSHVQSAYLAYTLLSAAVAIVAGPVLKGLEGAAEAGGEGGTTLYRLITDAADTPVDNFVSNAAKGLAARGPEIDNSLIHNGISMFDTIEGATSRISAIERSGRVQVLGIGELTIPQGARAISITPTLGAGHFTVTGAPGDIASFWSVTWLR